MTNPFQLTRAADLNDEQIKQLWVDPKGNFGALLRPSSPLPMFILGGRGSGKTHLMRYFSYPIQRKIHGVKAMQAHVKETHYLGIHTRCVGLNAGRFSSKRLDNVKWGDLFAFYLELWLGQTLLHTSCEFIRDTESFGTFDEKALVSDLSSLFDREIELDDLTLDCFTTKLRQFQRDLDFEVNNASFRRPVNPRIIATPGKLIFGIPQKFVNHVPCLANVMFTLFVDEYEHLYEEQQKHVNTLIRERENPVSFKIGARLNGMRTHKTWGGDEELREGSDYEMLNLDAALRENEDAYERFAFELCVSRVRFELGKLPEGWTPETAEKEFERCFAPNRPPEEIVKEKLQNLPEGSPWLLKLQNDLEKFITKLPDLGISAASAINAVVDRLRFPRDPLIEKTSAFLFYRAWSDQTNLVDASQVIANSALMYFETGAKDTLHAQKLRHFREDLRAQMLAEIHIGGAELLQSYVGIRTWIRMSDGIARNLITTLKRVFDWALFRGEDIYSPGGISLSSQTKGIREASNWFIGDAKVLGSDQGMVEAAIKRISTLLKRIRFSEKLPECSLCNFSVDINALEDTPRRVLETGERWSLLIKTADRKDRNSGAHFVKFRINGLVAPDFALPIYSRGNIHLSTDEANIIFGDRSESEFTRVVSERTARCSPPFTTKTIEKKTAQQKEQNGGEHQNEFDLF